MGETIFSTLHSSKLYFLFVIFKYLRQWKSKHMISIRRKTDEETWVKHFYDHCFKYHSRFNMIFISGTRPLYMYTWNNINIKYNNIILLEVHYRKSITLHNFKRLWPIIWPWIGQVLLAGADARFLRCTPWIRHWLGGGGGGCVCACCGW